MIPARSVRRTTLADYSQMHNVQPVAPIYTVSGIDIYGASATVAAQGRTLYSTQPNPAWAWIGAGGKSEKG